ncbi:MAG TPA: prolyl oligopeptidase family serine peptidase [Polyangiaceae bacterium]|nr:prolyl oligopeptidase family serine peptidase [Polyangiaceae bacterium]
MKHSFASASAAWSPALSPDGMRVAYCTDRDGTPRVWLHDRQRGTDQRLDAAPENVQRIEWSIDGDWLALLVAPQGSPRTQVWVMRVDGSEKREVGGSAQGATYLGPWTHEPGVLAVAEAAPGDGALAARLEHMTTRETRLVATGGQPIVLDLDRHNRTALIRRGPRGARSVWSIDLASGKERELLSNAGVGSTDLGRLCPDARVAYVRSNAGREMHALFEVPLDAGTPSGILAERPDADLEHIALTADGRDALLSWNVAGRSECELFDLKAGTRAALPLPEPVADDCSFSRDGRYLAMTLEGPTHPRAVWIFDRETNHWQRITRQAPDWVAPSVQPTLERLRSTDGLDLTGWLYRPSGAAGPGPAVIHLHGGPEAQERPTFNPLFQELAASGIAVFAPNVRGSSGFGHSFVNADNLDKRWGAIADVAACSHYLFDRGIAERGRLACAGRSYGGYLTLASLVFHPELFAAGVDVCGMADFHTFYAHTEPWIAVAAYSKYGHPERDAELLRSLSPIHRFDALRAPLLVVHGETDSNVPLGEAEQTVTAARARGVPVEFLLFREEGHELHRLSNKQAFVERTVQWLAAWLSAGAQAPSDVGGRASAAAADVASARV